MRHPNRLTKRDERDGKNRLVEKEIVDAEIKEPHLPTKRKKKVKKPWRWAASICPFCDRTLPALPSKKPLWMGWGHKYASNCVCGGSVSDDCPCCHKETWSKNDWKGDRLYKHKKDWSSCGFEGYRRMDDVIEYTQPEWYKKIKK